MCIRDRSLIIYDQTCAAEKRRRRKRGTYPDPDTRVVINELVCEGCGDCGVQSNCVAIVPVETEFGRKRAIDQSSCNKDYSCVKGFCPSFVSVQGGKLRKLAAARLASEKPGQTLQATALVHEAYIRLVGGDPGRAWDGRGHFFGAAAEAMRRILVDAARRKPTEKSRDVTDKYRSTTQREKKWHRFA